MHWRFADRNKAYDAINIKSLFFKMRKIVLNENMITCIKINL
jgi:hypothetical protein